MANNHEKILLSILYVLGMWISKPETARPASNRIIGKLFFIVAYEFPNDGKTQQQRKKWKFEFEDSLGN